MMKNPYGVIVVMGLLAIFISLGAACGSVTVSAPNEVHMGDSNFEPSSMTLQKGRRITLVNDVAMVHIIENGTWDANGNARSAKESGAPTVDAQINGHGHQELGPFHTLGTFHLYCTIHPGMKLTIVVK